jgi:hypothetical protein
MVSRYHVNGLNIHISFGVELECNLNLRHPLGRWWNSLKLEFSEKAIVLCKNPFTFIYLDSDGLLVI